VRGGSRWAQTDGKLGFLRRGATRRCKKRYRKRKGWGAWHLLQPEGWRATATLGPSQNMERVFKNSWVVLPWGGKRSPAREHQEHEKRARRGRGVRAARPHQNYYPTDKSPREKGNMEGGVKGSQGKNGGLLSNHCRRWQRGAYTGNGGGYYLNRGPGGEVAPSPFLKNPTDKPPPVEKGGFSGGRG